MLLFVSAGLSTTHSGRAKERTRLNTWYCPPTRTSKHRWEVNRILDSKVDWHRKGLGLLYLVEWKGFDNTPEATSWEPPEHLAHAPGLVQAFHRVYPDKPSP